MSWQTPDGDPPPEPAAQQPDAAPEPDAETARVPVTETPNASQPDAAPPAPPDAPPPAGIISAAPVGWTPPPGDPATGAPADGPVVPWSAPAAAVAATAVGPAAEGVVIARVFPRFVAYVVDLLLLGVLGRGVGALLGVYDPDPDPVVTFGVGAVLVLVGLLYFVGLWTSGLQGTIGMRILKLRILNSVTAGTLPLNDALLRWIALSGAIGILALVPGLEAYIGLLSLIWVLLLLITTATNPLHQGLHDRWARSVVVQPAPGGLGLAFATCLVLILVFGILLPVAGLALYGDRLREILIEIGNSV